VQIEQFDARTQQDQLRACHEMLVSGQPEDDPNAPPMSFGMFRGWWTYGFSGEPQQIWIATGESCAPVGCYVLELPERENRTNAFCYVVVGLAWRRRGIGTQLLGHAATQAEAAGRRLLMSNARVGAPGEFFARAVGARPGMQDVRRVLDVNASLHSRLPEMRKRAIAHSAGYSLLFWRGTTPGEVAEATCGLYSALADAPHDEAFEPATWDVARLRAAEERVIAQGTRWYSVAAMHEASGEMAALTQVNVDPDVTDWGFQEITAVTRPHRGHRLGMLVKVDMLQRLAELEPQIRHIMTFNAAPNEHMIAVNVELGNRISDYFLSLEMDVADAGKLAVAT
jgi:GNAT superfamily N-acetyltransferase